MPTTVRSTPASRCHAFASRTPIPTPCSRTLAQAGNLVVCLANSQVGRRTRTATEAPLSPPDTTRIKSATDH